MVVPNLPLGGERTALRMCELRLSCHTIWLFAVLDFSNSEILHMLHMCFTCALHVLHMCFTCALQMHEDLMCLQSTCTSPALDRGATKQCFKHGDATN